MKKYIAIVCTTLLAIIACDRELITNILPKEEMREISFMVDLPQAIKVATRGETGTTSENKINDIYVLVFDKTTEALISKSKGKNLTAGGTNENKVTFKATLPVGKEYTFMVLANATNYLNGIDVGMNPPKSKTDVMELTVSETGKWDISTSIPMWGEQNLTLTASSTPTFELTRMLARVNVEVNLGEISPGVPMDNFQLTSIRYYNYNTAGAMVPDLAHYDPATKCITTPTIPASPGTQADAIVYDDTYISDQKECKEQIYVFEAAHNGNTYKQPANNNEWIKNPCLVIGGKYKTTDGTWLEETFYRVDFIRKDKTDPQDIKEIWLSILRNFTYNIVITDVSGSGFPDPDIALESAPINMEANILEWNESGMGEIVFDGTFYLSVSQDEFTFGRNEVTTKEEDNILYVKTDYIFKNNPNDPQSGWYVEKYVDATDPTIPVSWLKLHPEQGAPNNRVEAYFTFDTNTGSTNREAIVWIAAGRLRYPVHIKQGILSLDIVDPDDNDNPISEIKFVVPKNLINQPSRHFKVSWTPVNQPVTISQHSPQTWNPFEPSWLQPDPSTTWSIPPGGTQTYQVNPPIVTSSDLDTDPFYERESAYSFTINNGSESYTKSINIHQVYYNILVDTYAYRLDGKTYTLSVRSNTDWVITNIEEWLYGKDPATDPAPKPTLLQLKTHDNLKIGTTGGPDINGTSVAFTVVDQSSTAHLGKWGVVYVTFENPDGKFEPVRVALRFPPNRMKVFAMGYSRDWRGYHVGLSNAYHTNTAFQMLNTQDNFGESPESTVYVRALDIIGFGAQGESVTSPNLLEGQWSTEMLRAALNENPNVVVITYSTRLRRTDADLIVDYINNGGAAILMVGGYHDESGTYARNFLRSLLGDETITCHKISSTATESDVYKFPEGSTWKNHPILDGPFGDLRGKHWGAHERSTGFKTNNAATYDQIEIINWSDDNMYPIYNGATNNNPASNHVVAFRHKTKNVIWIGNDTFTASLQLGTFHGAKWDPFTLDAQYKPAVRYGFGRIYPGTPAKYDTYNSFAVANMLAWAMAVTNHLPPVGGY